MLRHRDLLLQPTALRHESSLFFLFLSLSFVTFMAPTLPWRVCLCLCVFCFFFFCASSQGLTGHDAVDQIAATRRERHQHYHSWLCGARRVHQRRHHPQLSPRRRWRRRHLRTLGGGGRGASGSTVATVAGGLVCALTLFSLAFISRGELHGSSHFI